MTNTLTNTRTQEQTQRSTGKVIAWMDSWGFSHGEESEGARLWSGCSFDECFATSDLQKAIGLWKELTDQRVLSVREISEDLILTKWESIPCSKNKSYRLWYTLFKKMEFSEFLLTPHQELLSCDSPENGWPIKTYTLYR